MNLSKMKKSEDTEQVLVMQWANNHIKTYPELKWLHHIPNGGSRNIAEAKKLKAMGVKAGVSDLHLPYPKGKYHSLYIEMKFDKGKPTNLQKQFIKDMEAAENCALICYGAAQAVKQIEKYLNLKEGEELQNDEERNSKEMFEL